MGATTTSVDAVITRYRRRDIREADLELIRGKILERDGQTGGRTALAADLCEVWGWRQPGGALASRACLDLLLRLEEWGHIKLPPARHQVSVPRRRVQPILPAELVALSGLEVRDPDADLDSLVVRPIAPEERDGWRLYMGRYHYLGCKPIVGEHVLYAGFLGDELVALLGWASAAFRSPLREKYVGWDEATKREHLHLVANNVRFLVLPRVHVRNLASKILAANLRRLSGDWEKTWGHPIHLAETFVDTRRFRGTCYLASNWTCLGQTAGRTKRGNAYLHEGSSKALFVYPLHRQARRLLGGDACSTVVTGAPPVRDDEVSISTTPPPSDDWVASSVSAPVSTEAIADPGVSEERKEHTGFAPVAVALAALGASKSPPTCVLQQAGLSTAQEEAPLREGSPLGDASSTRVRRPGMNKTRLRIELTDAERVALEQQARGLAIPHRAVVRAKIVLQLAAGNKISVVARRLGCERATVRMWGERYERKRLPGLDDADRSGRPARFSPRNGSLPGQACLRAS